MEGNIKPKDNNPIGNQHETPQPTETGALKSGSTPSSTPLPNFEKITSSDINTTFKDIVSHAVFDVDFNELQQLMEIASRGQISIKEKEMLEKSEKNEELAERLEEFIELRERLKEAEEREREKEREEAEERRREEAEEKEAEEKERKEREMLMAAAIEERLADDNHIRIAERLEDAVALYDETGIGASLEALRLVALGEAEGEKEREKEGVDAEALNERIGELEGIGSHLEKCSEDVRKIIEKGGGVMAISKGAEEIAARDRPPAAVELGRLAREIKDMKEKGRSIEEMRGRLNEFVIAKEPFLSILPQLERLLKEWDELKDDEIAARLRAIAGAIRKEASDIAKRTDRLQEFQESETDKFLRIADEIFSGRSDIIEFIRRSWIAGIIDFINTMFESSKIGMKGKEIDFWKSIYHRLMKLKGVNDKSFNEFNSELFLALKDRQADLNAARRAAAKAVIRRLKRVADLIIISQNLARIEEIAGMRDKRRMKGPLERLFSELSKLGERITSAFERILKGDISGVIEELTKPFGLGGAVGRIAVKVVRGSSTKGKKKVIEELTQRINALACYASIAKVTDDAVKKGDYRRAKQLAESMKQNVDALKQLIKKISARSISKEQRRKEIAAALAAFMRSEA